MPRDQDASLTQALDFFDQQLAHIAQTGADQLAVPLGVGLGSFSMIEELLREPSAGDNSAKPTLRATEVVSFKFGMAALSICRPR